MCLELYKLVQGQQKLSSYRTSYFMLSVQYFVWAQPRRPQSYEVSYTSVHPAALSHILGPKVYTAQQTLTVYTFII